ncbi:MAG: MOSC domain-containing protein [Candidatus Thermoplasmatota archaeon]|nr:MOSC domain-containing protein [Candidatus Thermoplasmatota archaeon]
MRGHVLALALRPAKSAPMQLCHELALTPENGVIGDHGTSLRRQVTLLDKAAWDLACQEVETELPWITRRANILVTGIELQELVGRRVQIGTAIVEVIGEVDPCHVMDAAQSGLRSALETDWRGGVYAKVIEQGKIQLNDVIV